MPPKGRRLAPRSAGAVAILTLALLLGCRPDGGGMAAAAGPGKPGELVSLPGGQQINLRCEGGGSPTVLFESGFGAGASAWTRVQPQIARITRACAYDRAGYGFSSFGPLPRDGAAAARDLDQALKAAGIKGPYVVVGHSAGALYARLFAARRPGEVKGLVLLDPTIERRVAPGAEDGLGGIRKRLKMCLAAAEAGSPQDSPHWSACAPPSLNAQGKARALDPQTWRSQLSELDSIFTRTSEQVFRTQGLLGDIPTYVITASETAARSPAYPNAGGESAWEFQHRLLAGSFRHGWQRTVYSSHLVMIDRPDVVISAVREMVDAERDSRLPLALPPSENAETSPASALPNLDALAPEARLMFR